MATIPINNMTDTWNNGATTFRSILMNVTNTASATPSYLMDLQLGGSSMLSLDAKTVSGGTLVVPSQSLGSASALSIRSQGGFTTVGIAIANSGGILFNGTGAGQEFGVGSSIATSWSVPVAGVLQYGGGTITKITNRGVANTSGITKLEQTTIPQTIEVYNTTDGNANPTNYERGVFDWNTTANTLTIGTQAGGTGTVRQINLVAGPIATSRYAQFATNALSLFDQGGGNVVTQWFSNNLSLSSGTALGWNPNGSISGANDGSISRVAAKVLQFGDGATNANGWLQWGGEARLDADFSATSNTTLANVTGSSNNLSVSLQAGRKYIFDICLLMVTGASAGGIKIGIGGTATVTNLIADGWALDGTTNIAVTRVSASPGTLVANTNTGTNPVARFMGTFECNAAGTFTVQFAQNASSATSSTVKRGSYMKVHDAP